jgi:hypothetical protein
MIHIQQRDGGVDPYIKVSLSSADQIQDMRGVDLVLWSISTSTRVTVGRSLEQVQ